MIKAFRNFNPLNVIWLVVWLVILRVCYLFRAPGQVEFILVESFARTLLPFTYGHLLPLPLNMALAAVIVLIQALLLNYLVNYYNLLNKSTFLPALMYITVSGLFTPFLTLSAPLICNFLVIWMLFKMFELYKGGGF